MYQFIAELIDVFIFGFLQNELKAHNEKIHNANPAHSLILNGCWPTSQAELYKKIPVTGDRGNEPKRYSGKYKNGPGMSRIWKRQQRIVFKVE